MLRRSGLLAVMILGLLVVSLPAFAQNVSVFERRTPQVSNKYGVELVGGITLYDMSDVNDYRAATTHLSNDEDAEWGPVLV